LLLTAAARQHPLRLGVGFPVGLVAHCMTFSQQSNRGY
jgi:hypothetical protein